MASVLSEESNSVAEEGVADDDDYDSEESEDSDLQKAKQALTGRGVTLSDLMKEDLIQPGENVLSIDYRGQRFEADLLANGKIKWQGAEEEFSTPSAWATHCKKLVNPIKRSGCGWATVKYKGKKLDTWKSIWSRRHHPCSPFRSMSPHQAALSTETHNGSSQPASQSSSQENGGSARTDSTSEAAAESRKVHRTPPSKSDEVITAAAAALSSSKHVSNGSEKASKRSHTDAFAQALQDEALNLSVIGTNTDKPSGEKNGKHMADASTACTYGSGKLRTSVSYASLGKRTEVRDPRTFVKCEHFSSAKKTPFGVTVSTNALLLMDFHCHLSTTEVVGYLGGSWCPQTQSVRISHAFPCKCLLNDECKGSVVENEIRQNMDKIGCNVVGWYHSHPLCQPDPTLRDIECQMHYQFSMKGPGNTFLPCVGFILSPYSSQTKTDANNYQVYCVMPPAEETPDAHWIPMHLKRTVHQSSSFSEELLSEMSQLADFYRGSSSRVRWREHWSDTTTYLDKLKNSMRSKLPKDQRESTAFFSFIQQIVTRK